MADNRHFILQPAPHLSRKLAAAACMTMPDGYHCIIKPAYRTLEQNARLWSILGDVSKQVIWHGRKLSSEEWKHVFTASLKKQEVVVGLDGGFVVLGVSTKAMTKRELGDLMELIAAFGAQNGVVWSNDAQ